MKRYKNTAPYFPPEQRAPADVDYTGHFYTKQPAPEPCTSIQRRPPSFVAPEPAPKPVQIDVLPPSYELPTVAASAMLESRVQGSYQDRAKGFQIVSVPVALAFGAGIALVALLGFRVPLFSLPMLAVFWLAFLAWWLMAWALHLLFSADGVALVHTLRGWNYLEREQRARLKRYERGER